MRMEGERAYVSQFVLKELRVRKCGAPSKRMGGSLMLSTVAWKQDEAAELDLRASNSGAQPSKPS